MDSALTKQVLDLWKRVEPEKPVSWIADVLNVDVDDARRAIVRDWARQRSNGWDSDTKEG